MSGRKIVMVVYTTVMVKMPNGDWISVTDAAEILGLGRRRVHAIIEDGRLKPTKVGSVYLLLRSDVIAFAKKPRAPGRPKKPKK
jgi:excisionase family DNA binding protein